MITALAGGVGAATFLAGLVRATDPHNVTAIVNTADDDVFHGLTVCPDLDSVTYRLAGAANPVTGWGLVDETFATMDALDRYGMPTWFRLGDRDLATHLFRTQRLNSGATLSEVTREITAAWGLGLHVLPMSDAPVRTRITAEVNDAPTDLAMQEWFVRERCQPPVVAVAFDGADTAPAAPGVLDAIANAEQIIICPSNPVISIAPILAIPAIRAALCEARARVTAISPLIRGKTVKGPADQMMASMGLEASCVGVARLYTDLCTRFVIDEQDASHADTIAALGYDVVVTNTLMRDVSLATALAHTVLTTSDPSQP